MGLEGSKTPEILDVAKMLKEGRRQLQEEMGALEGLARKKGEAEANYDRILGLTIMKLRNGVEMELDGELIQNPPATLIEKIAKGICWREKLASTEAEEVLRAKHKVVSAIEADLDAIRSINKYLSEV